MVTNHNSEAGTNNEHAVIDVEEYAKQKLKIPDSGVIYFLNIEGHKYKVPKAINTGAELLGLAGKSASDHYLLQMFADGSKKEIKPTDNVDLSTFGVEKFNIICKTNTDGLSEGQRDFSLPSADERYLESLNLKWETLSSHGQNRVVIYKVPIADGYNFKEVDVAFFLPSSYPEAQIDMAYFKQHLCRLDGRTINACSPHLVGNEQWQRWSRHRTPSNPWRSGIDDISTHLTFVKLFLADELKRG